MSYILEALKQAQEHREEQQVPDLRSNHGPIVESVEGASTSKRRMVWYALLLTAAIIAGGVAGLWYGASREQLTEATLAPADSGAEVLIASNIPYEPVNTGNTGTVVNTLPESESSAAFRTMAHRAGDNPPAPPSERLALQAKTGEHQVTATPTIGDSPALPARATRGRSDIQPQDSRSQQEVASGPAVDAVAPIKGSALPEPTSGRAATPEPESVAVPEVRVAPPILATGEPVPAPPDVYRQEGDAVVSDTNPEAIASPAASETAADFRTLPLDVQQRIGEISFSLHLYTEDPAGRMLKIDGIIRRQGSEVADGLLLDEITPTGAIFEYGDYRFMVPVR